jgi:hypothetical protein
LSTIKKIITSIKQHNQSISAPLPGHGSFLKKKPKLLGTELVTSIKVSHGGGMGGSVYDFTAITDSIINLDNSISFTDFNTNENITLNNNFIVSKINKNLHFIEFYTEGYNRPIVPSAYGLYVFPLSLSFDSINWVSSNNYNSDNFKLKSFDTSDFFI